MNELASVRDLLTRNLRQSGIYIAFVLIILISAFFFLYCGAEIGFGAWVFTYSTRLGLANETDAALLNSAFWGAVTAGRLLSIPIASKVRPRTV